MCLLWTHAGVVLLTFSWQTSWFRKFFPSTSTLLQFATPLIVLVQPFEYLHFRFHYWNSIVLGLGLEDRLLFLAWIVSLIQFIVWPCERLYYPGWQAAEEEHKRNSRDECLGKWPVKLTLLPKKMYMNLSLGVFLLLVCQHNFCFCSLACGYSVEECRFTHLLKREL